MLGANNWPEARSESRVTARPLSKREAQFPVDGMR